jgi:SOS-response transcriptional repressor LexA
MDKVGLTPVQNEVYNFLRMYHREHGVFPTVKECCAGKIDGEPVIKKRSSTNGMHRILKGLEERKWIEIMPMRGRAIRLL